MSRRYVLALFAAAFLLLWNLNYAPLWNPDEGRYAAASLEMVQPFDGSAPDWIVPHLNSIPRLNKPPLVYWLTGGFLKLFGPTAGVVRLTSALAAVGVMLLLWQLGRRMFGERTGMAAALVWATCALPFVLSHTLNTDVLLTFCFTLAGYGLWRMSHDKGFWPAIIAGAGLGLALLTKGPVGVVLPIGSWGLWLLITERQKIFSALPYVPLLVAFIVMLAIGAPWYIAIGREHPEFLRVFLFGENLARFSGSKFYHNPHPIWFYLPVVLGGLFPWTAFLIPALGRLRELDSDFAHTRNSRLFLWVWAIAIIALFTISKVKLITYILPAMPALALLLAEAITAPVTEKSQRLLRLGARLTGGLLLLVTVVLFVAFYRRNGLSVKLLPASEIALPLVIIAVAAIVTAALLILRPTKHVAPVVFAGGAILFATLLHGAGRATRYEDPSPMLLALLPHLKKGDELVEFKTFQPTAIFYLNRPVVVVDFMNTSGLDEDEYISSGLFPKDHTLIKKKVAKANKENRRIYVLAKWKHIHWPTLPKLHVIAQNNDYRLLSNKPAPPGFQYEFITPFQRTRPLSPACKALSPLC